MSAPLAIAGVSAVLQDVLHSGMTAMHLGGSLQGSQAGDVTVSVGAPDRVLVEGNNAFSQLNVFLYNLARNPGWANLDLPSRDSRGARIANPALGMDLYYLLTAYGTKDYDAEVLLGGALQVLHDTPGLDRDEIRSALATGVNLPNNVALCGLADQVEQLKISPLPMSTEEIVRLWSAFQCNYRPSVAYVVSVVLLQSVQVSRAALPVRDRNVYAATLSPPQIDQITNFTDPTLPLVGTSTVNVSGANLNQPGATLWINGVDLTAGIQFRSAQQIRFVFPAIAAWPAGLYSGAMTAQLKSQQLMGTPAVSHGGIASNLASFPLAPTATVTQILQDLRVDFATPVAARQRVTVQLVELNPPAVRAPYTYSFNAADGNGVAPGLADALSVDVPISGVQAATYLVQVGVDGVFSPLSVDPAGLYNGPTIAL
jgi:hypothetical protein